MRILRKVLAVAIVCLLVSCFVTLTPHTGDEPTVSKLESPVISTPAPTLVIPTSTPSYVVETPARAAQYITITMTDEEREELAAIVFLEAGNQSAEGQQAVVEVIFNRVLHSGFPDTIHDVLHEGEDTRVPQFSTVYGIDEATPSQAQYDAIDGALYGDTILPPDVVFFSRGGENDRVWGQIGDHVFCYAYVWE